MKYLLPILTGIFLMTFTLKKTMSVNGINLLKFLEGEKFTVYFDAAAHKTVGVGHKVLPSDNLNYGDNITPLESEKYLRNDLSNAERSIRNNVLVPLNQNQFDALTSFIFNAGTGAFTNSTMLRKLNQYDYSGALAEFPRWKFVTINGIKQESPGLIKRRKYEQDLFNS